MSLLFCQGLGNLLLGALKFGIALSYLFLKGGQAGLLFCAFQGLRAGLLKLRFLRQTGTCGGYRAKPLTGKQTAYRVQWGGAEGQGGTIESTGQ